MLKSTLALLSFSAILQLIGASSVTITSPKANDVLKPGSEVKIEWSVNESSTQTIRIQYASGPSKELSIDGVIAENVSASLGHYVWKVPSNLKPKQYVIEAGPNDNDISFAGYVTVEADKKTTTKPSKKTTKKPSKKPTKKPAKKSTKKSTKKTSTEKIPKEASQQKPSAVCVGYPAADKTPQHVRCHSLPKSDTKKVEKTSKKEKSGKKHKTTKKAVKKSAKKSTKKSVKHN